MLRTCPECGEGFVADESWKRLCLPCWKYRNGIGAGQREVLQRANSALEREVWRLKDEVRVLRYTLECAGDGEALDIGTIRLLLQLVHPDRHNGSAAAARATRLLLEMKTRLDKEK